MRNAPTTDSTLSEYKQFTHNEWLKRFLDFRLFLRQRTKLLKDPETIVRCPVSANWMSPFQFAIQGTLSLLLLATVINISIGPLYIFDAKAVPQLEEVRRELRVSRMLLATHLNQQRDFSARRNKISILQQKIKSLEGGIQSGEVVQELSRLRTELNMSVTANNAMSEVYDPDEMAGEIQTLRKNIAQREAVLMTVGTFSKVEEWVKSLLIPVVPLVCVYLFAWIVRIGAERPFHPIDAPHKVYLYFGTAIFLPINVIAQSGTVAEHVISRLSPSFLQSAKSFYLVNGALSGMLAGYGFRRLYLLVKKLEKKTRLSPARACWGVFLASLFGTLLLLLSCAVVITVWYFALYWIRIRFDPSHALISLQAPFIRA